MNDVNSFIEIKHELSIFDEEDLATDDTATEIISTIKYEPDPDPDTIDEMSIDGVKCELVSILRKGHQV